MRATFAETALGWGRSNSPFGGRHATLTGCSTGAAVRRTGPWFLAHPDDRVRLYAEGRIAAGRVPLEREEAEPQNPATADDEPRNYEDFIDLEPDPSE